MGKKDFLFKNFIFRNKANIITFSRIIFAIELLFIKQSNILFLTVYFLCGFSDLLDGYIARKNKINSKFGSVFDSIADMIFVFILLVIFIPKISINRYIVLFVLFIILNKVLSIIIGCYRYNSFVFLHTYSNKITGIMVFILPLVLLFLNSQFMIYFVCIISIFSSFEELLLILISNKLDRNIKNIFIKS